MKDDIAVLIGAGGNRDFLYLKTCSVMMRYHNGDLFSSVSKNDLSLRSYGHLPKASCNHTLNYSCLGCKPSLQLDCPFEIYLTHRRRSVDDGIPFRAMRFFHLELSSPPEEATLPTLGETQHLSIIGSRNINPSCTRMPWEVISDRPCAPRS